LSIYTEEIQGKKCWWIKLWRIDHQLPNPPKLLAVEVFTICWLSCSWDSYPAEVYHPERKYKGLIAPV